MISDRIYQPTLHPLLPNVGTFLFHGMTRPGRGRWTFAARSTGWSMSAVTGSAGGRCPACCKRSSRFRKRRPHAPGRPRLGRDAVWVESPLREHAYFTDPEYWQARRRAHACRARRAGHPHNGTGVFNPVLIRPLFNHFGLVTRRTFETPAANTIPLFNTSADMSREIYGERAVDWSWGSTRPTRSGCLAPAGALRRHRPGDPRHLAEKHSITRGCRNWSDIVDKRLRCPMRLMFVHHVIEDRGSAQDMYNYVRDGARRWAMRWRSTARRRVAFDYSLDVGRADAVIFIFEWTTDLQYGDQLDLLRLCPGAPATAASSSTATASTTTPSSRRGHQPPRCRTEPAVDRRFATAFRTRSSSRPPPVAAERAAVLLPRLQPGLGEAARFGAKEYGMSYVGNNWFRWRGAASGCWRRVAPIRDQVGRIALVGHGWAPGALGQPDAGRGRLLHRPGLSAAAWGSRCCRRSASTR